mgnify:CR=1 FL=1
METPEIWIRCIGVDENFHICHPDSEICKCGIKVKTKKDREVEAIWNRYSCYECTY